VTSTPNVLIIGGHVLSLVNFRGDLIQTLLARGARVNAVAPGLDPSSPAWQTLTAWGAVPHGVSLARTGQSPVEDLRTARELYGLCRRLAPSHTLAYTAKPVIYGLPASRLAGSARTTALITGAGYAFTPDVGSLRQRGTRIVLELLYRGALRAADRVVFQNPDDQALFVSLGLVDRERCGLIRGSGINLANFAVAPLPPTSPALHFLLIARLIRQKGIYEYIEAARRVRQRYPQTQFHLVGMQDTNPAAIASSDLERWVSDGTIQYYGELADVRPVLARCHVYVLPSYREGTPRSVLEAMAMGRAIITTDTPGCRQTVEHGCNGYLVPVQDVNALSAAMLRFLEAPEQIARLGAASRERAERLYDVVEVNRQLLEYAGLG
jgi:glycosyltransferase involved in cell wall biosynthesis